ncbi:tetratricopeptide repeat protein [Defluviimonas sp. WL0050]|uniref:Tetratricopeptide repeat protein n=1 Tax=Albidovulum litorale TaxID=2984134 RepID=A0ABT2ZMM6_9RHOB|nr:tetratricopeptide repeat protein [Defluviimonas sp. WL0050]MCV2872383.1 tetratricopeptide repeat protein [Defluviimonas sp. WL0050]
MILNHFPILRVFVALAMLGTPAFAAGSNDNAAASAPTGMTEAQAAVDAGRYPEALRLLAAVIKSEPRNANALDLMGYSNRKMNRLSEAARYYDAALKVNPQHIGALGHQGELFVETGDYDRARQNLKLITAICGACEEVIDLRAALDAKGQS